jgi:hypothetical protein
MWFFRLTAAAYDEEARRRGMGKSAGDERHVYIAVDLI